MIPSNNHFLQALFAACSPAAEKRIDIGIEVAVRELLHRGDAGQVKLRQVYADLIALAGEARVLTAALETAGDIDIPSAAAISATASFEELSGFIDHVRKPLVDAGLQIAAQLEAGSQTAAWNASARQYLERLTLNEFDEMSRQMPAGGAGEKSDRVGRNLGALESRLRDLLAAPDLNILSYELITGGYSRDTFLLKVRQDDAERSYILRSALVVDGWWQGVGCLIEDEFPVLQMAWREGLAVPRTYALESDKTVIGSSFMVMEYCAGGVQGDTTSATGDIDPGLLKNLAAVLAQIHLLPWQKYRHALPPGFTPDEPATVEQTNRIYMEKVGRYYRSGELRPSPSLALCIDWLERNVPRTKIAPVVVHGDVGFHNILLKGPNISAFLDWDACSIGSPARDLVAAELMFPNPSDWQEFLRLYVAAGAPPPDEAEMTYYRMVRSLQGNLTCTMALERMFARGEKISYLWLGIDARPFFLNQFLINARRAWDAVPAASNAR